MKIFAEIKDVVKFIESVETIGFDERKKLFKLQNNDALEIDTWKERDITKHRKYFALMNCTVHHLPEGSEYADVEILRKTVQICIGNCDIAFDMQGNKQLQAKSIKFKGMDQVEFDELYLKSLNFISEKILSHISYLEFERDILNFY